MACGIDYSAIWAQADRKEAVSPARIRSAKAHRKGTASVKELRHLRRLSPESHQTLTKAAQTSCPCCEDAGGHSVDCGTRVSRLPASAHVVYSAIRTAIVRGWSGVNMGAKDLAKWTGQSLRNTWRALKLLRNLRLLSRATHFENAEFTSARFIKALGRFVKGRTYGKICVANSYRLGAAAPRVTSKKAPKMAQGGGVTKRHSNSLSSKGRGSGPLRAPLRSDDKTIPRAGRAPSGVEGAAHRRTFAPNGAQGVPSDSTPEDIKAEIRALLGSDDPWGALRAADKDGGAR